MSAFFKIAAGLLCVYALLVLFAYLVQRRMIYFPDRAYVRPVQVGLANVEERVLKMPDGARVIAWYAKARPGQPTLLYFHGNGGGLADRADRFRRFMGEGWGVYMMSYRGYSGSTGAPSERAIIADARLAHGALVLEGIAPDSIILYGESLGTGVAARMAVERPSAGLILEAPYTSILDMARLSFHILPLRLLLSDRYETDKVIAQVKVPVLILHGEEDGVIPVEMGRRLARLANEPKQLVIFPEGEHSNLYVDGNNAVASVRTWIAGLKN
ncbi:MAG: alpha/beta hydrolase [Hyphomicrobiaceae bacterium]|nr:MAG: alpha/beta hydrolase [Hyphomicrobiaceae bacterium]